MGTIIGTIISIAASAAIVLAFRQMDSDNRSIDKVKKYSEKLKGELDDFFNQKNQSMQGLSADLSAQETQAIASIKRLERARDDFAASGDSLEKKTRKLAAVESKLAEYDKTIASLVEMTMRAEQNLQKVSQDATKWDKRVEKLQGLEKNINGLESKIPEILQELNSKNDADLKDLGEKLLEEFSSKIRSIQEDIAKSISDGSAIVSNVRTQLNKAFNDATEKAKNLDIEIFDHVEKMSADRKEKFQSSLDSFLSSLRENFKVEAEKISGDIARQISMHESVCAEKLKRTANNADIANTKLQEMIGKWEIEMSEKFRAKSEELGAAIGEKFRDIQNSVDENIASAHRANETACAQLQSEVSAQIEQVKSHVANSKSEFSKSLDEMREKFDDFSDVFSEKIQSFEDSLADKTQTMENGFYEANEKLQGFSAELSSNIENASAKIGEISSDFNEKHESLRQNFDSAIERVSLEANSKLENMESNLNSKISTLDKSIETKYKNLFEDSQSRFDAYKTSVDERFDALGKISEDTDALSQELRNAMNLVEKRVRDDFSEYERDFENQTAALSETVKSIESEVQDLKSKSYHNVLDKLQLFEDEFFADLNARKDKMSGDFAAWKKDVDSQLEDMEKSASEKVLQKTRSLEQDYEQNQREITEKFDSLRQNAAAARIENESKIRDLLDEAKKSAEKSISAMESDIETWRDSINGAFESERAKLEAKFGQISRQSTSQIEEFKAKTASSFDEFSAGMAQQQTAIESNLDSLRGQISESLTDFQAKSDETREKFQKSYDEMLAETKAKIREQKSEADATISAIKSQLDGAVKDLKDKQSAFQNDVDKNSADIEARLDEIDNRIDKFTSQHRILEQADERKASLERAIETLKTDMRQVEALRKDAEAIESQFNRIRQAEQDVSLKFRGYDEDMHRIDRLDEKYTDLLKLSGTMDQKIASFQEMHDRLMQLDYQIRNFTEKLADVESRHERIDKKNILLAQTIESIDSAIERQGEIEKRVGECELNAQKLSPQLIEAQEAAQKVAENQKKIGEAVEKLQSLDILLADADEKIQTVNRAQNWLAELETRMDDMHRQLKSEVSAFEAAASGRKPLQTITKDQSETVRALKRDGWKDEQIAARLNISVAEVSLILQGAR